MNDVIVLHITVGQIYEIYYNYFLFQCCVNVVTIGMHFLLISLVFAVFRVDFRNEDINRLKL